MAKATIGERIYRRLLRLYPRDFSDDYADEMTCLYRDRVRGEGATNVWLALVADLARTAPREHISTLTQDVRYAWRTWRRTPVLALAAILTLAMGVGANTAVFSVVHAILLRPLPYPDADRLVEVFEDNSRAGGGPFFRVSLLNYLFVGRARPELRRIGGLQRQGLHPHRARRSRTHPWQRRHRFAVQRARRLAGRWATVDRRR